MALPCWYCCRPCCRLAFSRSSDASCRCMSRVSPSSERSTGSPSAPNCARSVSFSSISALMRSLYSPAATQQHTRHAARRRTHDATCSVNTTYRYYSKTTGGGESPEERGGLAAPPLLCINCFSSSSYFSFQSNKSDNTATPHHVFPK